MKYSMKKLSSYKWTLLGIALGGLGGFLYWKEIGCLTGTCPLQSHWQTMVPYGMLFGYLGADFIQQFTQKKRTNHG